MPSTHAGGSEAKQVGKGCHGSIGLCTIFFVSLDVLCLDQVYFP